MQQHDNKHQYIIYKYDSGEYFSLHLKSSDGHFYYILPASGTLKIYRDDTIKEVFKYHDINVYLFRIGSCECSNPYGPCPFKRMMSIK